MRHTPNTPSTQHRQQYSDIATQHHRTTPHHTTAHHRSIATIITLQTPHFSTHTCPPVRGRQGPLPFVAMPSAAPPLSSTLTPTFLLANQTTLHRWTTLTALALSTPQCPTPILMRAQPSEWPQQSRRLCRLLRPRRRRQLRCLPCLRRLLQPHRCQQEVQRPMERHAAVPTRSAVQISAAYLPSWRCEGVQRCGDAV